MKTIIFILLLIFSVFKANAQLVDALLYDSNGVIVSPKILKSEATKLIGIDCILPNHKTGYEKWNVVQFQLTIIEGNDTTIFKSSGNIFNIEIINRIRQIKNKSVLLIEGILASHDEYYQNVKMIRLEIY